MARTYDEGIAVGETCPDCGSESTEHRGGGMWKCEDCSFVWWDESSDRDLPGNRLRPQFNSSSQGLNPGNGE